MPLAHCDLLISLLISEVIPHAVFLFILLSMVTQVMTKHIKFMSKLFVKRKGQIYSFYYSEHIQNSRIKLELKNFLFRSLNFLKKREVCVLKVSFTK